MACAFVFPPILCCQERRFYLRPDADDRIFNAFNGATSIASRLIIKGLHNTVADGRPSLANIFRQTGSLDVIANLQDSGFLVTAFIGPWLLVRRLPERQKLNPHN